MPQTAPVPGGRPRRVASASPLILCDRLLTLAQEADCAGFARLAEQLLLLAYRALDEACDVRLAA